MREMAGHDGFLEDRLRGRAADAADDLAASIRAGDITAARMLAAEIDQRLRRMDPGSALPALLRLLADRAWADRLAEGASASDIPLEFCFASRELAEAFSAWRRGGDACGELADVFLLLISLARMLDVDLGQAVLGKMEAAARQRERGPGGHPARIRPGEHG
jgi:hypothetical protein